MRSRQEHTRARRLAQNGGYELKRNKQAARPAAPRTPAQETDSTLDELVEEFCGWWYLNREGSVNAAYEYIDKLTKRLQAALEKFDAGAAAPRTEPHDLKQLREDSDVLRHSNIIEIAVRNETGSVSDYMKHWEGRALKAEAELERLRAAPAIQPDPRTEPLADEEMVVAMLAACEAAISHLWDVAGTFEPEQCNRIRDVIHRLNAMALPTIRDLRAAPALATGDLRQLIADMSKSVREARYERGNAIWVDVVERWLKRLREAADTLEKG